MSRPRPQTVQACGVCGATVQAVFVCRDCMDTYHGNLARVPGVVADLRIEHARLAVKGGGIAGRGAGEQPLPYVEAASKALAEVRHALVTACRALVFDQALLPADRISAMCAWLAEREASIPLRPEGPDIVAELAAVLRRASRVCDSPPERVFIGYCQVCRTLDPNDEGPSMYARRGNATYRCDQCGTSYDVDRSLQRLEQELADYRLTFAEVEIATSGRIKADRVRKWTERGHLTRTKAGVRFGDVLGVEARMAG